MHVIPQLKKWGDYFCSSRVLCWAGQKALGSHSSEPGIVSLQNNAHREAKGPVLLRNTVPCCLTGMWLPTFLWQIGSAASTTSWQHGAIVLPASNWPKVPPEPLQPFIGLTRCGYEQKGQDLSNQMMSLIPPGIQEQGHWWSTPPFLFLSRINIDACDTNFPPSVHTARSCPPGRQEHIFDEILSYMKSWPGKTCRDAEVRAPLERLPPNLSIFPEAKRQGWGDWVWTFGLLGDHTLLIWPLSSELVGWRLEDLVYRRGTHPIVVGVHYSHLQHHHHQCPTKLRHHCGCAKAESPTPVAFSILSPEMHYPVQKFTELHGKYFRSYSFPTFPN